MKTSQKIAAVYLIGLIITALTFFGYAATKDPLGVLLLLGIPAAVFSFIWAACTITDWYCEGDDDW